MSFFEYDPYKAFFSPIVVLYSLYIFWLFDGAEFDIGVEKLSRLTYYVYLLHTPVLLGISKLMPCKVDNFWNVAILSLSTVILSFLGSIPFKKLCDRITGIVKREELYVK